MPLRWLTARRPTAPELTRPKETIGQRFERILAEYHEVRQRIIDANGSLSEEKKARLLQNNETRFFVRVRELTEQL